MSRLLSVAHLTAISLPPPDFIRAGFEAVGLRLPRTATFNRVLDAGDATPGPCAGTDAASGHSLAGGINLGPALTFGFIAGRQAAGANA
jgi:hypothetical protein